MKKSILFTGVSALFAMTLSGVQCGPSPTAPKAKIIITSPVAGDKVAAGDTLLVTWTQSVASPRLSYNYNFGAGWQQFASVIPVGNMSAKVVLPITSYTDSFQIKVEDNGSTYDTGISAPFSIKYIVITYPTAGTTLTNGSTVTITWKDTPAKLSSLDFALSTDNGLTYNHMLTGSISDLSQTSLSWVIGSELGSTFSYPSSQCILKISDYTNNHISDQSGPFSVQ